MYRLSFAGMLAIAVLAVPLLLGGQDHAPSSAASQASSTNLAPNSSPERRITAYTLPPDLYKKAHDLNRIHFRLAILGFVYGLSVLWFILRLKLAAKYRDLAEHSSVRRFFQAAIFSPLLLLTIAVLTIPLDIYGEWIERQSRSSPPRSKKDL